MNWLRLIASVAFFLFSMAEINAAKNDLLESNSKVLDSAYSSNDYSLMIEPLYRSFELDTILPNKFSFFYGAAMFHYKHNDEAEESLIKYLLLTRKNGVYYEEAMRLLALIHPYSRPNEYLPEELLEKENQPEGIAEEVDVPVGIEQSVPCDGGEFAVCPLCFGEGVQVSVGSFGKVYRTCPRCHGRGVVKCDDRKNENKERGAE